jgi:hypothetical protein
VARAIPAAIRPYSIAVAPLSSFKNLITARMTTRSPETSPARNSLLVGRIFSKNYRRD